MLASVLARTLRAYVRHAHGTIGKAQIIDDPRELLTPLREAARWRHRPSRGTSRPSG